jgi:hypothetical protein
MMGTLAPRGVGGDHRLSAASRTLSLLGNHAIRSEQVQVVRAQPCEARTYRPPRDQDKRPIDTRLVNPLASTGKGGVL